jgi:hypothetical protein
MVSAPAQVPAESENESMTALTMNALPCWRPWRSVRIQGLAHDGSWHRSETLRRPGEDLLKKKRLGLIGPRGIIAS